MGARLIVLVGPAPGQVFLLDSGRKTIGRGPTNDVDLSDIQISQKHCAVESQHGQLALVDLGSRNGTFVNQMRIDRATFLRDGDEIRLGTTRLRFSTAEDEVSQAASETQFFDNTEMIPSDSRYLRS